MGSVDPSAAAAFYGAVFGWEFQSAGPDAGGYGFFQKDGKTVAGVGLLMEEDASSAWMLYFQTPDAEATAKAVEQNGGRVLSTPCDVFEAGRMAKFTDPGGADFAVWQPAAVKGLEKTSEPGALHWAELHTWDPAAVFDFYQAVFGWRSQTMDMPGMTYTVLSTGEGDQQDASFGGLPGPQDDLEKSRWIPYFSVDDVYETIARVQNNGGLVLMPAADVPDVGLTSWLADPFGAPFAVIKPEPTQAV
nr:VOC family protein [Streptomyces sp. SID8354]